ncbi:MarR family transcriptional regulator [Bradyrhizobium sp. Arg237L]|uniref:MarR family winged helix-turn-helix transcriptional regulator n=1 Tax=Bradyrhizobium sp. Arg237L TaxID=3003352 RepID=UPI00249EC59E|nr:helix-turn-helix domain-containing protein [Bradyrhizobium sp. Arg237L]MDI4235415.1 MarR family transcriptional regulator [Bradyrhizobium sp. Arg237L]
MPSRRDRRRKIAERPADEEACNCTVLRKAARRVSMLYDRALDPAGIRLTQYALLAELDRTGPMTITELANAMVMERNGLGHNLQPLERDGLVRMEIGRDRRSRIIVMTEVGRQRLAEAKPLWRRAQKQFATAFEAEEIHALRALLTTAVAADYGDTTASD